MLANNIDNARFNMVAQQIRPCEVIDEQVLHILAEAPREKFVPKEYRGLAYADIHVQLDGGQIMMKPLQEASMLQALELAEGDKVLEIGTGSGFITACLAKLGGKVVSYEIDSALREQASQHLTAQGIDAELHNGDVFSADLPERGFDVIAVTGALPAINDQLEALLAPGGRMYAIIGQDPMMLATLITRDQDGNIQRETLYETVIPALQNAPVPDNFRF